MLLIIVFIVLIIIFLLIYKIKKVEKNKPISKEIEKEIANFMSTIDGVDIRNIENVESPKKNVTDDTLDLNDLFKTMSLTIVNDKSNYDFELLRNTKK